MFQDKTSGKIQQFSSLLLHVDGGCEPKNPGGVTTAGWAIFESQSSYNPIVEHSAVVRDGGPLATNNYGEYKALCLALKWLKENRWHGDLHVKADSKLLIEQVSGRWKVNAEHLKALRTKIWQYLEEMKLNIINESNPLPQEGYKSCYLTWIKRDLNEYANNLCRLAYQDYCSGKTTLTELLESVQNWT
jgi:ribonuclease HI